MDSNIIELVKLGHERADELKASCGAVDVRTVAQLISDLSSQLEVQYVRAEESQCEFRSADITMQNLEAQLKQSKIDADCYKKGMEASNARLVQLAAENAGLKKSKPSLKTMMSALDAFYADEDVPESAMLAAYNILRGAVETPATDAFLAEVRASALPVEIAEIIDSGDLEAILFASGYSEAERYRMALYNLRTSRKGVQS
ncbi:TPA: hypothetical protein JD366_003113 [Citrobacter amalonaticus]|nr:hypothetical protein [Citrobacter amalonaticus]